MATRMQQRRGTAATWTAANPILAPGELGFEIDTNKFKIGDGSSRWDNLTYFTADAAAALEALIDSAPGVLDTLNELAAAVNDDPNFFSTVATNLSNHEADTTNIHGISNTADLVTVAGTQTLTNKTLTSPSITNPTGIVKVDIGLGNVDNTSDANKPVSTAQAAADTAVANAASSDATSKANAAQSAAEATASADATSKANAAQSAAEATASADATSKANAALSSANTYTDGAVANLIDSAPGALDTLNELAAAIGDDANYASTITNSLALKAPIESPTFTGTVSGVTKTMVGLANVDNTSDANKPVSTAQAAADTAVANAASSDATSKANAAQSAAISAAATDATTKANAAQSAATTAAATDATSKANAAQSAAEATAATALSTHSADTTNIHGIADTALLATKSYADQAEADAITAAGTAADSKVAAAVAALTKSSVGLANVDNTSDANKPVSTATQTALDLKAPLSSPDLTGNPTVPTQPLGNDSTRIASTAFVKAAIQDISSLNLVLDGGGV